MLWVLDSVGPRDWSSFIEIDQITRVPLNGSILAKIHDAILYLPLVSKSTLAEVTTALFWGPAYVVSNSSHSFPGCMGLAENVFYIYISDVVFRVNIHLSSQTFDFIFLKEVLVVHLWKNVQRYLQAVYVPSRIHTRFSRVSHCYLISWQTKVEPSQCGILNFLWS